MNISLQTLNPPAANTPKHWPCLVLLHGWGFHRQAWPAEWLLTLQQRFCVILVDLPGHGDAAMVMKKGATLHGQAAAIPLLDVFIQQLLLQLPEQFHLMGWSLGGQVAMHMASQYPQRVQSLVSLAANPCFVAATNHYGMSADKLQQFTQQYNVNPQKTLARFVRMQSQGAIDAHCRIALQAQVQVTNGQVLGLHWLAQLDLRNALQSMTCQALHLFAQTDALVPIAVMQNMQTYCPTTATIHSVAGCHGLPFEYATPSTNNDLWCKLVQHWQASGVVFTEGSRTNA